MENKKYPRHMVDKQTTNRYFNPSKWIHSEEDEFGYVKKSKKISYWNLRIIIGMVLGVIALVALVVRLIQLILN